jgi:hypothetical protein
MLSGKLRVAQVALTADFFDHLVQSGMECRCAVCSSCSMPLIVLRWDLVASRVEDNKRAALPEMHFDEPVGIFLGRGPVELPVRYAIKMRCNPLPEHRLVIVLSWDPRVSGRNLKTPIRQPSHLGLDRLEEKQHEHNARNCI